MARGVDRQQSGNSYLGFHRIEKLSAHLANRFHGDDGHADGLGYSSRFPFGHYTMPDAIEKAGLSMVDVAGDGDDGLADHSGGKMECS